MLCEKPISPSTVSSRIAFPCGQCISCRISRRRVWAHRIQLESSLHDSSVFLTLTYDNDHLPDEFYHPKRQRTYHPLSVVPDHHKKFMKDLRYDLDRPIRFFGVGEYGEVSQRPHYHYALFGYPRCDHGSPITNGVFHPCRCKSCLLISRNWNRGHIFNGNLQLDSANYIAGYVTKKLTTDKCNCDFHTLGGHHKACPAYILDGRFPEFSRQSNRPGIAAEISDKIAKQLQNHWLLSPDEVPSILVHGSKPLPLGRYLKDRIHAKMGHLFVQGERLREYEKTLHDMFENRPDFEEIAPHLNLSTRRALEFLGAQRITDLKSKQRLYKKEKLL